MKKSSKTMAFEPIKAARAHEVLLVQLQQKILEGELRPGERLPSEREMMVVFGVSRPTVREALRVAESQGLVTVRHGDPGGPMVLGQPSLGVSRILDGLLAAERISVTELLEARMVLEGTAARLAAAQPSRQRAPVTSAFVAMQEAADVDAFAEADAVFHQRVAEASGNRLLVVMLASLRGPILRLIRTSVESDLDEARSRILSAHGRIVEAIRRQDGMTAEHESKQHLFELYMKLIPAGERARMQALLG